MSDRAKGTHLLVALKRRLRGTVAIAGVGNVLRGDDGAGPRLVEMLQEKLPTRTDSTSPIHLVNCGTTPENYIGRICRFQPDTVVVVDAAAEHSPPGEARIVEIEELSERALSTHELSPALFMSRLKEESGADVFMVAVRPATMELGESLSEPVSQMLAKLCSVIEDAIRLRQRRAACCSPDSVFRLSGGLPI